MLDMVELFDALENYIIGRYDNFKDICSFHIEYSHKKNEYLLQVYGKTITESNILENKDSILDGIYEIYQIENEPKKGRLYNIMLELESIENI